MSFVSRKALFQVNSGHFPLWPIETLPCMEPHPSRDGYVLHRHRRGARKVRRLLRRSERAREMNRAAIDAVVRASIRDIEERVTPWATWDSAKLGPPPDLKAMYRSSILDLIPSADYFATEAALFGDGWYCGYEGIPTR